MSAKGKNGKRKAFKERKQQDEETQLFWRDAVSRQTDEKGEETSLHPFSQNPTNLVEGMA